MNFSLDEEFRLSYMDEILEQAQQHPKTEENKPPEKSKQPLKNRDEKDVTLTEFTLEQLQKRALILLIDRLEKLP